MRKMSSPLSMSSTPIKTERSSWRISNNWQSSISVALMRPKRQINRLGKSRRRCRLWSPNRFNPLWCKNWGKKKTQNKVRHRPLLKNRWRLRLEAKRGKDLLRRSTLPSTASVVVRVVKLKIPYILQLWRKVDWEMSWPPKVQQTFESRQKHLTMTTTNLNKS